MVATGGLPRLSQDALELQPPLNLKDTLLATEAQSREAQMKRSYETNNRFKNGFLHFYSNVKSFQNHYE